MTAPAIPASQFTSTTSGVIAAGGNPLSLNAIFLTDDNSLPIGQLTNFPSYTSVASWFGAGSNQAKWANIYFNGSDNSTIKPDGLIFAPFPKTAVAGFLRSGVVSQMTITALQALTGTVIISQDGVSRTSASINLTGASSFSAAAALIQAGFTTNPPLVTYDSQRGTFLLTSPTSGAPSGFVISTASTTTITVTTAPATDTLQVGQYISGAGIQAGVYISALGTGTGGNGTYTISSAATATATGVAATVNASSISLATGTLSTALMLTAATGAVTSAGANVGVEAAVMNSIVNVNTNWVSFTTMWEPILTSKQAFAAWANGQTNYVYVCYDTDITATTVNNNTATFANILVTNQNNGTFPIWGTGDKAAFVCGAIGSVDYTQRQGWTNYAYRHQAGLVPDVTDQTSYVNLLSNGYNCYCDVTLDNNSWNFLQPGSVPGQWKWLDNYIDKIVLLTNIQIADMTLLNNLKALPANQAGIEVLRQSTRDPIEQAIDFGSIQTGIALTLGQAAEVNMAAGLPIDAHITQYGYYLQIIPSPGATRANRIQSRTLWYTSAQGINTLKLSALNVQ